MNQTTIYQTLEDRGNAKELEKSGPCYCALYDDDGALKEGVKEPWLGEGYYFWDTRIKDAHWWGKVAYLKYEKGYVIGKTTYDAHSDALFDLLGNLSHLYDFVKVADFLKKQHGEKCITFPAVIAYLKKNIKEFAQRYKAIRVWPQSDNIRKSCVTFPGNNDLVVGQVEKVQICFFDDSLFTEPFRIVEHVSYPAGGYTF